MVLLELASGAKAPKNLYARLKPCPEQNLGDDFHRLRLLGEVRMLTALVNLELGGHLPAHLGLGKHALDGLLDDCLRTAGEQLDEGLFTQTAGKTGIAAIELGVRLETRKDDLFGVDDDDVIAHIDIWGVKRVELACEEAGGVGGKATEGFAAGVDDEPLALNIFAAGDGSGHCSLYSLVLPSSLFGVFLKKMERICFSQQIKLVTARKAGRRESILERKVAIPHGASGIAQSLEKSAWEVGASGAALIPDCPK